MPQSFVSPTPPPPQTVAIVGNIQLFYTCIEDAPYSGDFTSSLHPHICLGWGPDLHERYLVAILSVPPGADFLLAKTLQF